MASLCAIGERCIGVKKRYPKKFPTLFWCLCHWSLGGASLSLLLIKNHFCIVRISSMFSFSFNLMWNRICQILTCVAIFQLWCYKFHPKSNSSIKYFSFARWQFIYLNIVLIHSNVLASNFMCFLCVYINFKALFWFIFNLTFWCQIPCDFSAHILILKLLSLNLNKFGNKW